MSVMKFKKSLYSKTALLKAAYNFTDRAYVHLDADSEYFYVSLSPKERLCVDENEFVNEMLTQSVRHEVYLQTKNVRELLLARAMATSVVDEGIESDSEPMDGELFSEDSVLKDWFLENENTDIE
jgi:His-Xaa-Ser system protein HxsD